MTNQKKGEPKTHTQRRRVGLLPKSEEKKVMALDRKSPPLQTKGGARSSSNGKGKKGRRGRVCYNEGLNR
jgi:hypothetical protein